MNKRIALYYRVSTDEQTTDPQRLELHDYCQRKGWPIARYGFRRKVHGDRARPVNDRRPQAAD